MYYCAYDQEIPIVEGNVLQGGSSGCAERYLGSGDTKRQTGTDAARYDDDYAFEDLFKQMFPTGAATILNQASTWLNRVQQPTSQELQGGTLPDDQTFTYALNEDCQVTTIPSGARSCGEVNIGYIVSPISLDFGGDDTWTTVKFKLSPKQSRPWVVWKASKDKPLLVYDPHHKGVVTDGRQLFGNWTFGGRKAMRMASIARPPVELDEWDNGYQALGELDLNRDGFVSGDELSPLALWFDKNKNARSERGEVVRITEAGITSLRTTYDVIDPLSGTIVSKGGYEKTDQQGIETSGDTLDWYTGTYESKVAAFSELDRAAVPESKPLQSATAAKGKVESSSILSGFWSWQSDADPNLKGVFLLAERKGRVAGITTIERLKKPNSHGVHSIMVSVPLYGLTSIKGEIRSLEMAASYQGVRTVSSAQYDKKKDILVGSSRATKGGPAMTYNWTAKRLARGDAIRLIK